MKNKIAIKLFEQKQVRTHWNEKQEKWYFSIIDVVAVLAENDRPQKILGRFKKEIKR